MEKRRLGKVRLLRHYTWTLTIIWSTYIRPLLLKIRPGSDIYQSQTTIELGTTGPRSWKDIHI